MAIPTKLSISVKKVKESELGVILEENPELFDEDESEDSAFNILTLFVYYERIKGP